MADENPLIANDNIPRDVPENPPRDGGYNDNFSEENEIASVLSDCRYKLLHPYLYIMTTMGLRNFIMDSALFHRGVNCLGYMYFSLLLVICAVGYVLQYMSCFRRDRGFCFPDNSEAKDISCVSNPLLIYIVPSLMQFCAYLYAVYLFRKKDNEKLQNLIETVFLLSANHTPGSSRISQLLKKLWLIITLGILWVILSLTTIICMVAQEKIKFHWIEIDQNTGILNLCLKIVFVFCTLVHDMIQATVIVNYCLQGELLRSHFFFLKEQLLHHTVPISQWIKNILEFEKLLAYFNEEVSSAAWVFTLVNISWAVSCWAWLLNIDKNEMCVKPIQVSILNGLLLILISSSPFIQAARLTNTCKSLEMIGREVRSRPRVYHDALPADLDVVLLYTSSTRMSARMFRVPISGKYLCFLITAGCIIILVLAQCHELHF